jgi:hypothetical protein
MTGPGVYAICRRLTDQGKPDKVARIAAARKPHVPRTSSHVLKAGNPSSQDQPGAPQALPNRTAQAAQPSTQHLPPSPRRGVHVSVRKTTVDPGAEAGLQRGTASAHWGPATPEEAEAP